MQTSIDPAFAEVSSLLDSLARFTNTLDLKRVPDTVLRQAGLCVLDTIGCTLAGADTPEGAALFDAERALGGSGQLARVIGRAETLPLEAAARVHGYWGDIFELNDLIGGHASIGNVAAALALVEACNGSGAALLKAVIAGIEVTSRVYASVYPKLKPYTDVAMVTPGLVSAFGAAAVAASLRALSRDETREALAIAGTLTTWCPAETVFGDGGTVKPMLFGAWPAAIGLRAAGYAQHGMTGPGRLLESRIGLFATLCREYEPRVIADDTHWFLAEPRRKLHACCGYTHSAIDLVISLRAQLGADVLARSKLRIAMPAYVVPAVSKSALPHTANEARFHLQYCVALAACGADVILPQHSVDLDGHLQRPELRDMLANIEIVADPELAHYHQCRITVSTEDVHHARSDAPCGSPQNPLSDAQVIEKFQRLASFRMSAHASAAYASRFMQLEQVTDCRWIFDELLAK
ncbi:MmgE/PrpD family protein [Paraburkholderia lacunae]|nr:MmgE/PrpD family protein [Paraburkholderia lacunae]